jgi:hypothetical protein
VKAAELKPAASAFIATIFDVLAFATRGPFHTLFAPTRKTY